MSNLLLFLGSIILFIVLLFFLGLISARNISKKQVKKRLDNIYEASPFREKKKKPSGNKTTNDFKARDERKEVVTGKAASREYEKLIQKEKKFEEELEEQKDEPKEGLVVLKKEKSQQIAQSKIVGIARPMGIWTRLIMSQKMQFLLNFGRENQKGPGFFQNLIRAQARSQSKEKSRGR